MSFPPDHNQINLEQVSLLQKIAQNDHLALSQLYDRYAQVIYAVAFKSLGSVEESEEVVLDVFAQVWRTAKKYDPSRGSVDIWLFMMARSRILDRLRYLQRTTRNKLFTIKAEIQSEKVSVDPIEDALISERRLQVLAAIRQIPEAQQQVIDLAFYQGLTHHQIAAQTGLSLGTVKTRIRLGLNKLRVALGAWL
jgi:RNA polymerase sigma-70 factor (ECF subfamily)